MKTSQGSLHRLQVEYRQTPLGIDVTQPRFSWQMANARGIRGQYQQAYRILVKNSNDEVAWDSGRVFSSDSLHIVYQGWPLQACTTYNWAVTVWDQNADTLEAESWFETGLMNSDISAWEGAKWIGGDDSDLCLYADYLPLYNLSADLHIDPGSTRASILLAANDPRLCHKDKNIYQLHNGVNQSYFRVELDVGEISRRGGFAHLRFYRAGYSADDVPDKPLFDYVVKPSVINHHNQHQFHHLLIHNAYGTLTVQLNNQADFFLNTVVQPPADPRFPPLRPLLQGARAPLNPAGNDHRVITYGMLNHIGFLVEPGQQAQVKNLAINNVHAPRNTLFREHPTPHQSIFSDQIVTGSFVIENGHYALTGGVDGLCILANPSRNSMPMLRREFALKAQTITKARLYVTARGIYEFFINGQRISNDYYNPGLTQYNRTHLYQSYDVTDLLRAGSNAMGAQLAEGWWSGMLGFGNTWHGFGDRQSLLVKLVVEYQDGSRDVQVSDDQHWQFFNQGPVVYGSLIQGEVYDANKAHSVAGWSEPGFNTSRWTRAHEVPLTGTVTQGTHPNLRKKPQHLDFTQQALIGQIGEPAREFKVISAREVRQVRPGVFVYDLGQNIVGVPRIDFNQGQAGQVVTLRYAEMCYPDRPESGANAGMILTENYRAALSQDIYIMKAGKQCYQPRFTFHGFQYIEITGIETALPLTAVQGVVISSIAELTAGYQSSDTGLNKLWSNIVWSNIDNFLSVPTDCPQRNERMGWSGDISVFSRTASYISDCSQFLRRHLISMRDTQSDNGRYADIAPIDGGFGGLLWGCAGIVLPWEIYWQFNDIGILAENYTAMLNYLNYLDTTLDPATGLSRDQELGDWLGPQNQQLGAAFPATAYHVYALGIVAKTAALLGHEEDAASLKGRYHKRKAFLNTLLADTADTQSFYAIGLALGVFEDQDTARFAARLNNCVTRQASDDNGIVRPEYSLMTGFIGTAWIGDALSAHGYGDTAYRLFLNDQYPSLLYSVRQGASTIWERLNGYTTEHGFAGNNSMNSFNHYSFGAVGQWLMSHSAGIQRATPGFKTFALRPEIDGNGQISAVDAWYQSPYGKITSHWWIEDNALHYKTKVPANTTATLHLPVTDIKTITESGTVLQDSAGISAIQHCNGFISMQLQSGEYHFNCQHTTKP
ncbi:alpha-L-rhamnosidase [Planctobacterium marinum]|uniref:alpha-L-rhamnosidase n=1 Tax=Planctobacterium marinum TaxID=1631968 RepID=UPI001E28D308|nr:alpha-L-rhamnosidase [Planctobacterium marinum]MCC2606541.1 glycoside hydrolase family 78 protein [Planctobacterium marinum]